MSTAAHAWRNISPIWVKRSSIAAGWLLWSKARSVLDIGCGAQALRWMLGPYCTYVGVDVTERSEDTVLCDLNVEPLPDIEADACSVLGVLEYLDDVPAALAQIARYQVVVLSYCQHSIFQSNEKRLRFWRNHYSARQFRALLREAGFEIVLRRRFRFAETIYFLARKDRS